MSLHSFELGLIKKIIDDIPEEERNLWLVSCPDILLSTTTIREIFHLTFNTEWKFRDDAKEILKWHNCTTLNNKLIDTQDFFEKLGFKVFITDIVKSRGNEEYLDLNLTYSDYLGREICPKGFNLIIDNSSHHAFNIGQAFKTMVENCAMEGYIFNVHPFSLLNNGFYNFNPCCYFDFYEANGFEVEVYIYDKLNGKHYRLDDQYLSKIPDRGTMIYCIAQKVQNKKFSWPVQRKFREHPLSKL